MQRHLQKLLLLVAMMVVPWVTQGQGFSYSCNFDNDFDTAGWVFVQSGQTNQWFIGTATHNSGTKSLYVSNDNGSSNTYTNSAVTFAYAYHEFTLDSGIYAITYDWKCYGESNYDYIRVFLAPASHTLTAGQDPSGGTSQYSWSSAALPTGFISLTGSSTKLNLQSSWQNFLTEFYVPTSGTWRLVFAWANDGSAGSAPPGAIDNISFIQPTCPQPSGIVFSNIAATSFDVSWHENGSATEWLVQLDSAGTILSSDVAYDTTYSFLDLTDNTPYVVHVSSICGSADTSMQTNASFRTPCAAIDNLPYSNGFEDDPYYSAVTYANAFPYCWTRINDASGTYNYYPYITTTTNYVHSGSKGMYWYFSTSTTYANNEYAVLPPIDTTVYEMSDLTLSFYAKTTSTSYHPAPIVGVMTNPSDASTFTPVYTFSNTEITTDWVLYVISFADYEGYGNFIAIKCPRPSSTAYMALDDIYLTDEWCDVPAHVTANPSTDEVTVSWDYVEGTSYTVILGTDTIVNLYDSSYTFVGLTPNTQYTYAVATECATSLSPYIGGSVHTTCVDLDSLPYTQDFEAAATGGNTNASFVNCMQRLNNGTTYFGYPYVGGSTYNHTSGGAKGLYWYNTTTTGTYGDYQIVVMPGVDTDVYPIRSLQFSFWARASSTSYSPSFDVGVMTNPTDPSTFVSVAPVSVGANTTWREFEVALGTYTGTGRFVALRAVRPSSSWYAYVDDLTLKLAPTCPHTTSLTANTTASAAVISWNYSTDLGIAPDNYEVAYRYISDTFGSPITTIVSGLSYVLTGLDPDTSYTLTVTPICGTDDYGEAMTIQFSTAALPCLEWDTT